ncbi:hypothetical protein NCCP2145_29630 [Pseudarthrobacter sp. NCCP-2145]|nr:hypothetical protein NCCP2145_29630 [Pseudarthrobacter sp. NCCP-2145]
MIGEQCWFITWVPPRPLRYVGISGTVEPVFKGMGPLNTAAEDLRLFPQVNETCERLIHILYPTTLINGPEQGRRHQSPTDWKHLPRSRMSISITCKVLDDGC